MNTDTSLAHPYPPDHRETMPVVAHHMKRKPEYDRNIGAQAEALATALTNYANGNLEELKRLCQGVWPDCDFYRGGTHLRVLIEGTANGKSFYVETV